MRGARELGERVWGERVGFNGVKESGERVGRESGVRGVRKINRYLYTYF